MTVPSELLILVDGSSYLYRAFHALPALTNSKGFPTGAVYGMVNMIRRLMLDYHPKYMAIVFDAKGKTFRDELYTAYKATRQAMPDDLTLQIEPIHKIIRALGIPLVIVEGVEADDVIGTLALHASQQGIKTLISTGDKDLAQLVNDHVTLINTMTNVLLDRKGVIEKFGVPPERMIDYLTLVGDTSDNIPGVSKVGPKTAAKWLQEYQSLDNIIEHAHNISGKVGENLREFIPQIPLTKSLVTIKQDVTLPVDFFELELKAPDKKSLLAFYKEMEFKTWLSDLLNEFKDTNKDKYQNYVVISDEKTLDDWLKKLNHDEILTFNLQVNDADFLKAKLVGIAIGFSGGKAAYIPLAHDHAGTLKQLEVEKVLSKLKPLFENPKIKKLAQNIKNEMKFLARIDIHLTGIAFDSMLESYILDSASSSHDTSSLALKYLGWRTTQYEEIAGKGAKEITFNLVDVEKAGTYAAEIADVTLQLHQQLSPRINEEPGLKRVFEEIEMPLISVLAHMESTGVLIDPKKLREHGKELEKRLIELEEEAFLIARKKFNINSPKQIQEILFQELKLPVLQKTPKGQPSTADEVLKELALEFALPRIIIEYRSLSKLMSTYTTPLIAQINPDTGRVHTSYNQSGTATGRLSSSDPNLQNIPIRMAEGRRIRQAFIAPPGYKIISADYSQIELRLMAHLSNDPNLVQAFLSNLDIHQATASEVWGVKIEDVTQEMRRNAKAINFGLIYGISAFGLAKQLGIDRQAAQTYIERYFTRYPKVRAYMDNSRQQAKEKGYVETLWGRRLYVPDIHAAQFARQRAAERIAINAPLQGSAADIIKLAMIEIDRTINEEKLNAKMIMQVHDELVFEVPQEEVEAISRMIRHHMTEVVSLRVPILVAIGLGDNWDEASDH